MAIQFYVIGSPGLVQINQAGTSDAAIIPALMYTAPAPAGTTTPSFSHNDPNGGRDGATFSNISASTAPFQLAGGKYGVIVTANFAAYGGQVTLQGIGPDGVTPITALASFSANGYATVDLSPGLYEFLLASPIAVYASVWRIGG